MSEWELPKNVETQSIERVGGGFAWESGVYDATVKMVYLNQSASEAVSFNVERISGLNPVKLRVIRPITRRMVKTIHFPGIQLQTLCV